MDTVGEHPVPAGPLAVRWLGYALPELRAGAVGQVRVRLENAGSATWRSRNGAGIRGSYHWLDDRGNPVVWDALRSDFPGHVAPGERAELTLSVRAPRPPGRYLLAFDLLDEGRRWFAELGSHELRVPVDVRPRIADRRLAVELHAGPGDVMDTRAAVAAQQEPVVEGDAEVTAHLCAGALPAPDWSARVLDAHAAGYAAVGGTIVVVGGGTHGRRLRRDVEPWRGDGPNPNFRAPLLLPSLVRGLEPGTTFGLPAWTPDVAGPRQDVEPWLFDGRIVVRLRLPRGRRRA